MPLKEQHKKHLRKLGHDLEPIILTGNSGLTAGLVAELNSTLDHHELVKVRVRASDRDSRDALIGALCEQSGAELVQRIGHVALLWRPNPQNRKILLPNW
jgi:RNA-binding protein